MEFNGEGAHVSPIASAPAPAMKSHSRRRSFRRPPLKRERRAVHTSIDMKKALPLACVLALAVLAAGPVDADVLYDNTNGFVNNFNEQALLLFVPTADSFKLSSSADVQDVNFWVWEGRPDGGHADDMTSVDWSIVDNDGMPDPFGGIAYPFDGTVENSGTASPVGTFLETNSSFVGYDIYEESFATGDVFLDGGTTYWLVLESAPAIGRRGVFWDESDGPSAAYSRRAGDLHGASQTFQLLGTSSVPEPRAATLSGGGLMLIAGLLCLKRYSGADRHSIAEERKQ